MRKVGQMVGHGSKFGRRKEAAIAALLSCRTLEEAARTAGIGATTLLRWMKNPEFQAEYRAARNAVVSQATARLQQASGAAATTIVKIMLSADTKDSNRLRAAELTLSHSKDAQIEDMEARLSDLEADRNLPSCAFVADSFDNPLNRGDPLHGI